MLKEIKDFPKYFVDNSGNVFSKKREKIKKLNPAISTNGYMFVCLRKNNKTFIKRIHRLVAEAFILNPDNKTEINHIDGNKLNNNIVNLEWCNRSENIKHAFNILKRNKIWLNKFGKNNPHSKPVFQIKNKNIIAEFAGIAEAARITGINKSSIWSCCHNEYLSAGGFQWEYKKMKNNA